MKTYNGTGFRHVHGRVIIYVDVFTGWQDEMTQSTSRKGVRIFVARIPPHVTEGMFRR